MQELDLSGAWQLKKSGETESIPAIVPGCVHTDLLAAGRIPDPFHRDNENSLQWIGRAAWVYSREFDVPAYFLKHRRILLRCEMLDTIASVRINGGEAGRADNMFRTWEFGVKRLLKPGKNRIEVRFDSAYAYIAGKQRKRALGFPGMAVVGSPWIRKEPCNFGWDWGPTLVTAGIQRPLSLVGYSLARLENVHVRQRHQEPAVTLDVSLGIERIGKGGLKACVSLWRGSDLKMEKMVPVRGMKAMVSIPVPNPELWWPAGMGSQPLYEVTVDLLDAEGSLLDTDTKRVGLRTLKLRRKRDRWGESFEFLANGAPFFAKGANWIPADVFLSRVSVADYRRLLVDARDANMNMLRVWGGGVYEDDAFYDLCDELGLCIWQDFMFACNGYPAFDAAFMNNVRAEVGDNVRRLRHHPSLAIWCGNNELEMFCVADKWEGRKMSWSDYRKLFDRLIPEEVRRHDPERDYWPSSSHTPCGSRKWSEDPASGDSHLWAVWHGMKPFEWYRTTFNRFVSEFGFQSFTEPRTVREFTRPEDRNVTSPVMEHHQRSGTYGNGLIMHYMLSWFRLPQGFEDTVWVSQLLQALAIKYAVEHWRRNMPRVMGALYWQLNDCWPVASWASIDFPGRWKALHYAAKKFFAPVLISGVEDPKGERVHVHVTSDLAKPAGAQVRWTVTDVAGRKLAAGRRKVRTPVRGAAKALDIDVSGPLAARGPGGILVWLELLVGNRIASENMVLFARPKQMDLRDPAIEARVRRRGSAFVVALKAKAPALWAWIELRGVDARLSDNFVHLKEGRPVRIEVKTAKKMSARELSGKLVVRSLWDTFR